MKKNNKYLYMGLSLALALSFGQVAQADDIPSWGDGTGAGQWWEGTGGSFWGDFTVPESVKNMPPIAVGNNSTFTVPTGVMLQNTQTYVENGAAVVTGTWDNMNGFVVGGPWEGSSSNGTLNISNGGKVISSILPDSSSFLNDWYGNDPGRSSGVVGVSSGSTGTVNVTGQNSTWENQYDLSIGVSGQGTLNVGNGGLVESQRGGYIGANTGSTGTANVTGQNSIWKNQDDLSIGVNGQGTLNVENGGLVKSQRGYIGAYTGSTGTANVTGQNSIWENQGSLHVGVSGDGTLNIENGGVVKSTGFFGGGYIGEEAGSTGAVVVSGEGSHWKNDFNNLSVGIKGSGTLNVSDGGKVTTSGDIQIASENGSTGLVTVTGNLSEVNSSNLYIGGNENGVGGNGNLIVYDGGTVSASNVTIWSTGHLVNDAGVVNSNVVNHGLISGDGGTIIGNVTNFGEISPGNSPGILTITGDLILEDDSVLLMEIFGPTAYDQLIIGGNFVASGMLELDFGGYMPEFDTPYDLFQIAGGMSGDFSEIKFLNPAAGFDAGLLSLSFAGGENGGMFQLIMANNGDPGNNTVPEPASTLLFGFGALALLWMRRRNSWA